MADEKYFTDLPGGVLESVGRLFKRSVKMYVYPTRDPVTGEIQSLETGSGSAPWHHLRRLLLEIGRVEPIRGYDESYLSIRTPDVLARIQRGDASWEQMVPAAVAEIIKAENLFGWHSAAGNVDNRMNSAKLRRHAERDPGRGKALGNKAASTARVTYGDASLNNVDALRRIIQCALFSAPHRSPTQSPEQK